MNPRLLLGLTCAAALAALAVARAANNSKPETPNAKPALRCA